MTVKIALIGSAPSSVALAPYDDPSWKVWACSPGSRPHLKRCDAFFEIHKWEPEKPWFSDDYKKFLAEFKGPVFTLEPTPAIPQATVYPKEQMVEKYGPYFFTSTLSWMFALAIEMGADEIGLWGVDMSAQEEWFFQRSGCHFFIWEAQKRGIKVTIPQQSDLLRPPPLYGWCELDPYHQKLLARGAELDFRINSLAGQIGALNTELMHLRGAREDVEYMRMTWVSDRQAIDMTGWTNPEPAKELSMFAPQPAPVPPEPLVLDEASLHEPDVSRETAPFDGMKTQADVKYGEKTLAPTDLINAFLNDRTPVAKTTWETTPALPMSNGLGA